MEAPPSETDALALKIKRLVKERGWNQEEFARITRLNRHTVRQILAPAGATPLRKLRNSTVGACARALGLTVSELTDLPLERLLPRMVEGAAPEDNLRRGYEEATQPELRAWIERNPDRARQLSDDELDELLAMQGPTGALASFGVEAFVRRIERRRELVRQVGVIAATEYLELLEQFVGLLYDKVRPPGDGVPGP